MRIELPIRAEEGDRWGPRVFEDDLHQPMTLEVNGRTYIGQCIERLFSDDMTVVTLVFDVPNDAEPIVMNGDS